MNKMQTPVNRLLAGPTEEHINLSFPRRAVGTSARMGGRTSPRDRSRARPRHKSLFRAWPGVRRVLLYVLMPCAVLAGGCPGAGGLTEFDRGFDAGFEDGLNFVSEFDDGFAAGLASVEFLSMGFEDSWLTKGESSMYRAGSIPVLEDESFEAGLNEGHFAVYNDGYFNAYQKSIVPGFQTGYNEGFQAEFAMILAAHKHREFAHGGYVDGFNDGFSEGMVFGAEDFSNGLPASVDNWRTAYADWFKGIDVFVEEVGVGSGKFGDVVLYEIDTDPADLGIGMAKSSRNGRKGRHARSRGALGKARLTLSGAR